MRRRFSMALFALATLPSTVRAQQLVQVCLPEAATRDMRDALSVELRARGHDVIIECVSIEPSPAWVLSLEAADALADVWVHAVPAHGQERRARAGGPFGHAR